jgi:hypothetical protein
MILFCYNNPIMKQTPLSSEILVGCRLSPTEHSKKFFFAVRTLLPATPVGGFSYYNYFFF